MIPATPLQHRGQGLSLKRQLLLWLLLPQLVLFLVGGALAYRIAHKYAEKAIDQSLTRLQAQLGDRRNQALSDLSLIEMAQAPQEVHALAAAVNHLLTKMLVSAQRSAHLVHQLLSLARNEVEVNLQPLDMAALARDWTPRALKAGIDLGFEGEDHFTLDGEARVLAVEPHGLRVHLWLSVSHAAGVVS